MAAAGGVRAEEEGGQGARAGHAQHGGGGEGGAGWGGGVGLGGKGEEPSLCLGGRSGGSGREGGRGTDSERWGCGRPLLILVYAAFSAFL